MWSLHEWRRQRILAQHPVAPDVWHNVRQHLSILDGLNDEQDQWLRERSGLDNAEMQLCHAAVHIPSDPAFSSLNLAAAVQVVSYELRCALLAYAVGGMAAAEHPRTPPPGAEAATVLPLMSAILATSLRTAMPSAP